MNPISTPCSEKSTDYLAPASPSLLSTPYSPASAISDRINSPYSGTHLNTSLTDSLQLSLSPASASASSTATATPTTPYDKYSHSHDPNSPDNNTLKLLQKTFLEYQSISTNNDQDVDRDSSIRTIMPSSSDCDNEGDVTREIQLTQHPNTSCTRTPPEVDPTNGNPPETATVRTTDNPVVRKKIAFQSKESKRASINLLENAKIVTKNIPLYNNSTSQIESSSLSWSFSSISNSNSIINDENDFANEENICDDNNSVSTMVVTSDARSEMHTDLRSAVTPLCRDSKMNVVRKSGSGDHEHVLSFGSL